MEVFGLIWIFNGMEFSNENNQKKLFLDIFLYKRMESISARATKIGNLTIKIRTTVAYREYVLQYMIILN